MTKRCKHENVRELIWCQLTVEQHATGVYHITVGEWHWRVALTSTPQAITCVDCGHWLPLGESNDAGCAVEIRAAELVADCIRDDGSWDGFVSLGMCSLDAQHAPLIEADIAAGRKHQRDLDDYYAGHLAAVIAAHEEK